jgi:hypothetical protein
MKASTQKKKIDKVMVWKFESAPMHLRALQCGKGNPHWLALVPPALQGDDLSEAIQTRLGPMGLEEYKTETGDIVYIGSLGLPELLELVAPILSDSTTSEDLRPQKGG